LTSIQFRVDVNKISAGITELSNRINLLEEKVEKLNDLKRESAINTDASEDHIKATVQQEVERLNKIIEDLKRNVELILKAHDETITEKMGKYATELKSLLANRSTSKSQQKSSKK